DCIRRAPPLFSSGSGSFPPVDWPPSGGFFFRLDAPCPESQNGADASSREAAMGDEIAVFHCHWPVLPLPAEAPALSLQKTTAGSAPVKPNGRDPLPDQVERPLYAGNHEEPWLKDELA